MIDWTHWHNEPYLIGGLIFLGWLYALLTGPLRSRVIAWSQSPQTPPPYPRRQAIMFYSGLVIFYLAVGSPLDQAGERYLLSAHMVQHQLIIYPAAVLFLLGLPDQRHAFSLSRQNRNQRQATHHEHQGSHAVTIPPGYL